MGISNDALKDFLLGRTTAPEDAVFNNIMKLFGLSKYQIYQAKRNGYAKTAALTVLPPQFSITDDIVKDAKKIISGERELKDSYALGQIPIGGKFYYWWWGGGDGHVPIVGEDRE
jgi:hypothetical protein